MSRIANSGLVHAASAGGGASPEGGKKADQTNRRPKFYCVTGKPVARGSGFELLNDAALFTEPPRVLLPPLGQQGFRKYREMPVFLADARLGAIHRDFEEYSGYWFISDRAKAVLERIDPSAFAFLECRVQLRDGADGPRRWLCDVVRVLDALDEERSKVMTRITSLGTKSNWIPMSDKIFFREERVGSHHVFRVMHTESYVICDEEMKLACKAAALTGIMFEDLTGRHRQ
jgi:hypothetical protein